MDYDGKVILPGSEVPRTNISPTFGQSPFFLCSSSLRTGLFFDNLLDKLYITRLVTLRSTFTWHDEESVPSFPPHRGSPWLTALHISMSQSTNSRNWGIDPMVEHEVRIWLAIYTYMYVSNKKNSLELTDGDCKGTNRIESKNSYAKDFILVYIQKSLDGCEHSLLI